MKKVYIIILGFLFLLLDVFIQVGNYPEYIYTNKLANKIQEYVMNNYIGDKLKIDIFPDIVGYTLLIIGAILLISYSKKFIFAIIVNIAAAISSVALFVLPFVLEGRVLCISALVLIFISFILEIFAEYLIVINIGLITKHKKNDHTNSVMMIGWFASVFCKICILFSTLFGLTIIRYAYNVVLAGVTILFLVMIYRLRNDLGINNVKDENERGINDKERI